MSILASPFGPKPQFSDSAGLPLSGGKLFFYAAGSTTKQNTLTDSTGLSANTNPIVLNARGEPTTQIWFTSGLSYKAVLAPSTDTDPPVNPYWTVDNIAGINDTSATTNDEWVAYTPTVTYVSATSFTVVGDQTTAFHVGRRVKCAVSAGLSYGTITASAFGAVTTVTVDTTGSNALDSGLSAVSYSLTRADNFTQSLSLDSVTRQGTTIASAATLNLDAAGGSIIDVSGTTTISAITLGRGKMRFLRFTGALSLVNGASLVLPTGANIITQAGDFCVAVGYASSVVRILNYQTLGLPTQPIQGNFTYDISTATGTQAVTGLGFRPRSVHFLASCNGTVAWSSGFDLGPGSAPRCVYSDHVTIADTMSQVSGSILLQPVTTSVYATGTILTLDAGGFTIQWTKVGAVASATASISYIAYR